MGELPSVLRKDTSTPGPQRARVMDSGKITYCLKPATYGMLATDVLEELGRLISGLTANLHV